MVALIKLAFCLNQSGDFNPFLLKLCAVFSFKVKTRVYELALLVDGAWTQDQAAEAT